MTVNIVVPTRGNLLSIGGCMGRILAAARHRFIGSGQPTG